MKDGVFKKIVVIASQRMSCKKKLNFLDIFEAVAPNCPEGFRVQDHDVVEKFLEYPEAAYAVYEKILNEYVEDKPTKGHHFVKMLQEKGILHSFLTGSIDLLDRQAGFSAKEYNHIDDVSLGPMCAKCKKDFNLAEWSLGIMAGTGVSYCECGGPIKPRQNFQGMELAPGVFEALVKISADADLVIALDT